MIEITLKRHLKGQQGLFELDIDMQLEKGGFYALMGESGVGKTSSHPKRFGSRLKAFRRVSFMGMERLS